MRTYMIDHARVALEIPDKLLVLAAFLRMTQEVPIGTVCNLAARLCAEAKDGQILLAQPVAIAVEETIPVEEVGELALRGLTQPVLAYNVPLAAGHPALRVIEGGPANI